MAKIAINGFGRIGRLAFRRILTNYPHLEVVAINDLTSPNILAHLLKYDSSHGVLNANISADEQNIVVNGKKIPVYKEKDPSALPWAQHQVDVVIESTGLFLTKEAANKRWEAGAKRGMLSAPAKEKDIKTVVYNVNHTQVNSSDLIISAASCTTNALAPLAYVLSKTYGIKWGYMTTTHAYTADQRLQDAPHNDLRRARAAAYSMIPTSTGAAKAIGLVLPELSGKMDGIAIRVPVITGSLVDLTVELETPTTLAHIHQTMQNAANESFAYCTDPIVSADVINDQHGAIFDAGLSMELNVDNKKVYKLFTWYDNESSYVAQFIRVVNHLVTLNKF